MLKERLEEIISNTKGVRLSKEKIFDGGFVKVYKEEYKLPDNRVIVKESVSKNDDKDAAIIITRTIDDKYLVVFQNRVNNIVSAEFPSGYIEKGEDVKTGALREVEEETGYSSNEVFLIDTAIPNIGTESSKIHIVYIKNAIKKQNQDLDTDEFINYELFTFEELKYLLDNKYMQSSGNKLAFYLLKEILAKENDK